MSRFGQKVHLDLTHRDASESGDLAEEGIQWLGWDAWVLLYPTDPRNYKEETVP